MGMMKEAMMLMGDRGYIMVNDREVALWSGCVGRRLPVVSVEIEGRFGMIVERGLPAAEARLLADDARLDSEARQYIRWMLEVAGLDSGSMCECGERVAFRNASGGGCCYQCWRKKNGRPETTDSAKLTPQELRWIVEEMRQQGKS